MKTVLICIEILTGTYFIEISDGYLYSYFKYFNENEKTEELIVDMEKGIHFYIDSTGNIKETLKSKSLPSNVTTFRRDVIDSSYQYLNYPSLLVEEDIIVKKSLNDRGSVKMKIRSVNSHIKELYNIIPEKQRSSLLWIGTHYNETGYFVLEKKEVFLSNSKSDKSPNEILIFKVRSIKEVDTRSERFLKALNKVKTNYRK